MRVGLVISGSLDTLAGSHLYERQLVKYLRGCGDDVEVFSRPARAYARQLVDNVATGWQQNIEAAPLDVLLQAEASHPALLRLNRRLRGRVSYPIVSIVDRLRCYGTDSPVYGWIERRYLTSVAGFICTSETMRRAVGEALHGARAELARSLVAYPGGDPFDSLITPHLIQQRAHEVGPLRLVFVGEAIKRQGLLVLLEALLQLPAGTCQLVVVGDTNVDASYTRVVYHLLTVTHLAGVTLVGEVSEAELAALLARSHVLVVPSENEGFGTAYLAGMGCGLPAIGTTSGAAHEIITDGVNGYLVPPNDPAAVAERLRGLAAARSKLADMGLAAHERFLAQPGWKHSMAQVRQALLDLVGQ